MTEPAPRERIVLEIDVLPDPDSVPAGVRLRQLQKFAGRYLWLKVVPKRPPQMKWAGWILREGRWHLSCLGIEPQVCLAELKAALQPGEVGVVVPRPAKPEETS